MAVTFSNNGDVTGQKIGSRDTGPLDSHSRFQHTVLARLASDTPAFIIIQYQLIVVSDSQLQEHLQWLK